jgi:hypothetical protein
MTQAHAAWRMCRGLSRVDPLQQSIYTFIFCVITVVLLFDGTVFVFISLGFQPHLACTFIAVGDAAVHVSCACFSVVFLARQSQKESISRKLLDASRSSSLLNSLCGISERKREKRRRCL